MAIRENFIRTLDKIHNLAPTLTVANLRLLAIIDGTRLATAPTLVKTTNAGRVSTYERLERLKMGGLIEASSEKSPRVWRLTTRGSKVMRAIKASYSKV